MDLSPSQKADAIVGDVARRRVLTVGGFSVAAAAVLAACGKPHKTLVPQVGLTPSTSGLPEQVIDDVVLLRTASSLEHSTVKAYDDTLAAGVLPNEVLEAVKLFQAQHRANAALFEQATKDAGGAAFTSTNPVVDKNIVAPSLAAIKDSAVKGDDAVRFVHALESITSGTYQSFVPALSKPKLRATVMSVGAVEARQAALLAKFVKSDGGAVVPGLDAAVPATTTSTAKAGGATTEAKATIAPVYQVAGPFGALGAVVVNLNAVPQSFDLPGPNSFMYK